jgi:hypothetical protein
MGDFFLGLVTGLVVMSVYLIYTYDKWSDR